MSSDRAFQNRLNRVISDIEVKISNTRKDTKLSAREQYCHFIMDIGEYIRTRLTNLEEHGARVSSDLKSFANTDTPRSQRNEGRKTTSISLPQQPAPKRQSSTSMHQQQFQQIQMENNYLREENSRLREERERYRQAVFRLEHEVEQHGHYFLSEKEDLRQKVKKAEEKVERSKKEANMLKEEKERALNRRYKFPMDHGGHSIRTENMKVMQQVAGSRLKDGNPSIADLSDSNRPTSLSMQLSELYSNEWTNAFEVMVDAGMGERKIIECLLQCISAAFTACQRTVEADTKGAENKSEKMHRLRNLPSDQRLAINRNCVTKVLERISPSLDRGNLQKDKDIRKYVDECVNICWLMCVQDPPLDLIWDFKHGIPVDTNAFTFYTKSGKYVDYVVWPALYLHKHGPILGKGVLQGCS